jgi:hypothetical protein
MSRALAGTLLLLLLSLLAIWHFELLVPLAAGTLIRIRGGSLRVVRGSLRAQVLADLTDMVRQAGVTRGFICINARRRIIFSRNLPASIHQHLRNVLANP